ncbi:MAG: hypothetical protein QXM89_03395 [Candidatus Bathyarchaeia archaeon]
MHYSFDGNTAYPEVQIPRLRWLDGYSQHAYFDSAIGKSTSFTLAL